MKIIVALLLAIAAGSAAAQNVTHTFDFYHVKLADISNSSATNYRLIIDSSNRSMAGANVRSIEVHCPGREFEEEVDDLASLLRSVRAHTYLMQGIYTPEAIRNPGIIPHVGVSVYDDGTCRFHALGAE